MTSEKSVIGIVGEKGAGKESVGNMLMDFFAPNKVVRVRSSDILAETLVIWNLPQNRFNLQHMAIAVNGQFGAGTLSAAVKNRIEKSDADIIIFDGVRWESDIALVKSFKQHAVIYVTADAHLRYERTKKRKQKVGEDSATFEQFLEEEKVATELQIPVFGKSANFTIFNNGSMADLEVEVKKLSVKPLFKAGE